MEFHMDAVGNPGCCSSSPGPANVPGKAAAGGPCSHMGDTVGVPGLSLVQLLPLWPFGK